MALITRGECNRCGECCKTRPEDGWFPGIAPVVSGYCPMFRWQAPGVGLCVGRDTEFYRTVCAPYPTRPQSKKLTPSCSIIVEGVGHMNHISVDINADDTVCIRICNRSFCIEVEEAEDLLNKLGPIVKTLKKEGVAGNRDRIAERERTHQIDAKRVKEQP